MLSRRKIELRPGGPGLPLTLITRQDLIDCGQAHEVLAHARARADELLSTTQKISEAQLEQARGEFWQQANAQLSHWQMEQARICEALESCATSLVNQALQLLLNDVPPDAQIAALLAQLLRAHCPPVSATLRCHPQAAADVQRWLSGRNDALWQLQSDERLPPRMLVLVTAQGDLRIDWPTALETLQLPASTHGTVQALPATE